MRTVYSIEGMAGQTSCEISQHPFKEPWTLVEALRYAHRENLTNTVYKDFKVVVKTYDD